MKKDTPRRWMRFEYDDGTHQDIEIGKVTVVQTDAERVLFHIDRMPDGKHLIVANKEVMPEGKKIENIRMVREG